MTNHTHTRPKTVSAETVPLPDLRAFKNYYAGAIHVGDLLLIHGVMYRVKMRTTYHTTPYITFVVWPCAGGQAHRLDCLPAQIVQAVIFDTNEGTRPLRPILG
jgi:hypothetical protein